MGMTLEEYAAQNPQTEPAEGPAGTARTYRDRLDELEQIDQLKAAITRQLEEGNEPQLILYTAIKTIGLLTHDQDWAEEVEAALDAVYSDISQESLLMDRATIAAQRLEAMQGEYTRKLRAQTQRQLAGNRRLESALKDVLRALDGLSETGDPDT